ncbi:1-phosphatidylinositol phosphodiesterase-like [Glandiceps talaboti]
MGNKLDGTTARYPKERWPDWMKGVPDDTLVSNLSIPGTHASISCYGMNIECQHWPLQSQLEAGIRFIDIGCRHYKNGLPIHEVTNFQYATLSRVFREVVAHLKRYNSETIVVHLREEAIWQLNTRSVEDTLDEYITDSGAQVHNFRKHTSCAVQLGEVRGKMILLLDFEETKKDPSISAFGKRSRLRSLSDVDVGKKWDDIKTHLYKATSGEPTTTFLTFLGGSCGFHSQPSPFAVASKINEHLLKFIGGFSEKEGQRLGIVAMDFPTEDVVKSIIKTNGI